MAPLDASLAARRTARDLLLAGQHPGLGSLLPAGEVDRTASLLARAGLLSGLTRVLGASRWLGPAAVLTDRFATGGALGWLVLRTRWLDERTRAAVAAAGRQVLLLGTGWSAMGWRLAEDEAALTVVEAEQQAVVTRKRAALALLDSPPNLTLRALHDPRGLAEVLGVEPLRAETPTVLVVPTALMDLGPQQAERLLALAADLLAPQSTLLLGYRVATAAGGGATGPARHLLRLGAALAAEPARWAPAEGQLAPLLEACGWSLRAEEDRHALRRRYLAPAGLERLALPRRERVAVAVRRG